MTRRDANDFAKSMEVAPDIVMSEPGGDADVNMDADSDPPTIPVSPPPPASTLTSPRLTLTLGTVDREFSWWVGKLVDTKSSSAYAWAKGMKITPQVEIQTSICIGFNW